MLLSSCKNLLSFSRNGHITLTPHKPSMAVSLSPIRYLSSNADNIHSFTVSYLINSCGLSPKSALSASKSVNLKSSKKPDSVLSCFQRLGFSKTYISEMVRKYPPILNCKPEKTIYPKVDFFRSRGASTPELVEIFTTNPYILRSSLENRLVCTFNMLAELFRSEFKALEMMRINPWVICNRPEARLLPNINTLQENGVPASSIMLLSGSCWRCIVTTPVKFRKIVEEVKELGFNPSKSTFVLAINILLSVTKPKWDTKVEVYKRWGWSDEDVNKAFRMQPSCMAYSEDKVMAAMDFYVNQIGLDCSVIVNCPKLVGYSLKKRLIPRGAVIQALSTKGLLKMDSSVANMFKCTDKHFIERYIIDPQLEKLYNEKLELSVDRDEGTK